MTICFEDDLRTRAEQRVISALLRDPGCIRHCQGLRPRDFSHSLHGTIFAAILQLIADDMPVSAVRVHLVMRKTFRASDDVFAYLLMIGALPALPAHAGYYAAVMGFGDAL